MYQQVSYTELDIIRHDFGQNGIVYFCREILIEIEFQSQIPRISFLIAELNPPFLAYQISKVYHSQLAIP